ncbi:hypothetical protein MSAN_01065200 [Mycena sanguinolenta]|uniref:Uncharacterized protein n=1 Tax=Mycena sanguinolenta TaxID=230812 RepID=A0A8H6YRY3_9AGAR|nr:hypothetical protein MSAN_01065200 [Mycena sanguinolenta]
MDDTPILPLDLEREIFEFAACSNVRFIPVLVLVAKRVRSWIEPLLYRTLSIAGDIHVGDSADVIRISTSDCFKILESKPASFFHNHVRHLAFTRVQSHAVASILSQCSGAFRLALFQTGTPNSSSWLPSIEAMSLLQISANVNRLFGNSGVDFHHDAFARLTHLDLFEVPVSENWATDLCRLPRLTHLSFNFDTDDGENIDATACRIILGGCKSLGALVLIFEEDIHREEFESVDGCPYFSDDPRSVTMVAGAFLDDWERGATGQDDYWAKAEMFIQKRRSGEIKGREYSIPLDWEP